MLQLMKKLNPPNATISLNSDCVVNRNIIIIIRGINLSSLLSIVKDFMMPNLLKMSMKIIGVTNVVAKTVNKQTAMLMSDVSHIPEAINTSSIHVGNNTGCVSTEINWANLFIVIYSSLRRRATGMSNCSRYLAMVRLAML